MLRVQPANPVPPGRAGVVWRQRLGRHGARAAGGEHLAPAPGRPPGLLGPGLLRVSAHGLVPAQTRYLPTGLY